MTHSFPTRRSSDLPGARARADLADGQAARPHQGRPRSLRRRRHDRPGPARPDEARPVTDKHNRNMKAGEHLLPAFFYWRTGANRSEEHTSELQSLMRNSYAVLRLSKKNTTK